MNQYDKQVKQLRAEFLKKLEESDSDIFHPFDVNRVKTDDKYLSRFIMHNDGNQETALTMLWETCEWRKNFGVNDINEKNVNQTILESGSLYSHGKDKDGKTLLIFKSKKHFKNAHDFEDQKRCLVYWMERLERQENGDMISLFFDMDGAVLGNMDMDYTMYLINLFKSYYPHFLNYIIIFEMAWVLNAMFRIIKSWLPPKAVVKLKFVNKSSVKDLVDPEFCLKSWGGKDSYVFHFEPEERTSPAPMQNGDDIRAKKVHFAESSFKKDQLNESGFEESVTSVLSTSLSISPPDIMVFAQEGSEVTSSILLKNEDSQCISYKIKTTSPEKFRVRPSSGLLNPGASTTISVVLLPGYPLQSLQRDKFLIMSIPLDQVAVSSVELNDLWKVRKRKKPHRKTASTSIAVPKKKFNMNSSFQQNSDREIQQHRLRCGAPQVTSGDYFMKNGSAISPQTTDDQKMLACLCSDISRLNTCMGCLKEEMKLIRKQQWIILFSVILLLCSLSYVMYTDHSSQSYSQNCWTENRKG